MPFLIPLVGVILVEAGAGLLAASLISVGLSLAVTLIQKNKRKDATAQRQANTMSMQLGEGPRTAAFGKCATGGRVLYGFNAGEDNKEEWLLIKFCDHPIDLLFAFWISDEVFEFEGAGAQSQFTIDGVDHLVIYPLYGDTGQVVPADVLAAVPAGEWTSADKMTGCSGAWVKYVFNDDVWTSGRPQFKWHLDGHKCYDPRFDSTQPGGSGTQRWNDPSTHVHSRNMAVMALNYRLGVYNNGQLMVGRGLTPEQALGDRVAEFMAYANICDEAVDTLDGPGARYEGGIVVNSDEAYIEVMGIFAECCAGEIVPSSGGLSIVPGHAQTPVASFTDLDLVPGDPVEFQAFLGESERCNTVIPRFVDEYQGWVVASAPMRRDFADVVADGRPYETQLELSAIIVDPIAQRIGEIARRRARLERNASISLRPRFCNVEAGDWVTWTSARYMAGATATFLVMTEIDDVSGKKRLTLREISADCYAWDYLVDEIPSGSVSPPADATRFLEDGTPRRLESGVGRRLEFS